MFPRIHSTVTAFLMILTIAPLLAFEVPKGFHFISDESGFRVIVKGVEVLLHTETEPMLFVGKVHTTFTEQHGNWSINEDIQQKVALPQFSITHMEYPTHIKLWAHDGPEVELELKSENFNPLVIWWVAVEPGYDRVWVRVAASAEEQVYGAGAQTSLFDLRGHHYPIWTSRQVVTWNTSAQAELQPDSGSGFQTSHFPLPTFVSSRRYYCHVNGSNYIHLDFRHPAYHEISISGRPEALYFNVGESFEEVIRSMTYFLWREPPLPAWVHTGAILGVEGGTKKMLDFYSTAKASGVQVSGLWIRDWAGSVNAPCGHSPRCACVWNEQLYPGLVDEVRRLAAEGVRVLTYVTPHLDSESPLFEEAARSGFLLMAADGRVLLQPESGSSSGTVDLTHPAAFDWYKGVLTRNLIDLGFGGWMADLMYDTPVDVHFHNGVDAHRVHNAFPALWAQLNREVIADADRIGDVIFFMRTGGTGSPRFATMVSAGDQPESCAGTGSASSGALPASPGALPASPGALPASPGALPATVRAMLSLGLSGVGLVHFDIRAGGPDAGSPELLLREAEVAVFTVLMRTHPGSQALLNSRHSPIVETFGTLTRQYRHLAAYRKAVELQQYRQGLPMQRPLFLHYQTDAGSFTTGHEYLFGRDLLVAPVLASDVTSGEVFLPADKWEHLWTGQVYMGPATVTVAAPLGAPPVFFRVASAWSDTFRRVKVIGRGREGDRAHEDL